MNHIFPMQAVIAAVSEKYGCSPEDVIGPSRKRKLVLARQEAAWIIRDTMPEKSLNQIGRALGNRDHTTIIHGIRQHAKRNGGSRDG